MNWLITGGCGFIGCNLIRTLLAQGGHAMRVVDNLSVGTKLDLQRVCILSRGGLVTDRVELVVTDILDEQAALKAVEGIDVVVHLAANTGVAPSVENPRLDCVTNVIGTLNYLEACRHNGVKKFIFASSGAPIGECIPPIHEELPSHPVSPYGASKLAGEGYCSSYFRTFNVQTSALRFGNVYGPLSSHKNSAVAKFIQNALSGKPLDVYGDGGQTRDFIYIDDIVSAIIACALCEGVGGEIFQIATNQETSVSELVTALVDQLAQHGIGHVEVLHSAPRLGDVMRNFSDTSKARRMLGWEPKYDLPTGLKATLDWYLKEK